MVTSTIPSIFAFRSGNIENPVNPSARYGSDKEDAFAAIFQSALSNISETNGYLSKAENEEIKLAMGQSESTHDLAVALQKASVSLQYTVAVKNAFVEAYRQIMQMQI